MAALRKLRLCTVSPKNPNLRSSAAVIFLHGSGHSGSGLRSWIRDVLQQDLSFNHIKIVYPTSPPRPYTPMRQALSNVWFDRRKISPDCPEDLESIDHMCDMLGQLIQEEVRGGTPKDRIIIGGFSMGGAMALHLACRHHPEVGGVFVLSGFLNKDSVALQAVGERHRADLPLPPLFQCHGNADELVLHHWGVQTSEQLKRSGISAVFHSISGLNHELNRPELELLRDWILTHLPEETPTDPHPDPQMLHYPILTLRCSTTPS